MRLNIKIETDPQTLARWNFKEEGLAIWDDRHHVALPLSRVSGEALKKILNEWFTPPEEALIF